MNQTQVDPCPFCGDEVRARFMAYYTIGCQRCKIATDSLCTYEEALFRWNRREDTKLANDFEDFKFFLEFTALRHEISPFKGQHGDRYATATHKVRVWCDNTDSKAQDESTSVWWFDATGTLLAVNSYM